ncbi:O-methyltransferase [Alkaliflexus imshenetskii]|jgi:caffeoyl-CoA O-methyltransferase|uniref:O-methyltransferase n=1 Tax=Alkaliflexus imshenetskii TaxID=286730 RepID=UPI00047CA401|nr:O-methyltransferase [Alkaliflexus imshenetskii]
MDLDLEKYILEHIDAEEDVLRELDRFTHLNVLRARMLSGHLQGTLLKMLCRMINPQAVLEIGTFTGYSAISMVRGLSSQAHIHTIEVNDELESVIRRFFHKAGVSNQITLHIGDALDVIDKLTMNFDLVFMDGDKRQYPAYYNAVFPRLNQGGYILADNILWGGKVSQPNMPDDEYTKGIMDFNDMVKADARVEKVILPIRDGLTLIRKK